VFFVEKELDFNFSEILLIWQREWKGKPYSLLGESIFVVDIFIIWYFLIYSTGIKNRIQVSSSTASLLIASGKEHWLTSREDIVNVKGKGILSTYWLCIQSKKPGTATNKSGSSEPDSQTQMSESDDKNLLLEQDRLVDWICELLQVRIKNILVTRVQPKTPYLFFKRKKLKVFEFHWMKLWKPLYYLNINSLQQQFNHWIALSWVMSW
jgi:hypothetical protein